MKLGWQKLILWSPVQQSIPSNSFWNQIVELIDLLLSGKDCWIHFNHLSVLSGHKLVIKELSNSFQVFIEFLSLGFPFCNEREFIKLKGIFFVLNFEFFTDFIDEFSWHFVLPVFQTKFEHSSWVFFESKILELQNGLLFLIRKLFYHIIIDILDGLHDLPDLSRMQNRFTFLHHLFNQNFRFHDIAFLVNLWLTLTVYIFTHSRTFSTFDIATQEVNLILCFASEAKSCVFQKFLHRCFKINYFLKSDEISIWVWKIKKIEMVSMSPVVYYVQRPNWMHWTIDFFPKLFMRAFLWFEDRNIMLLVFFIFLFGFLLKLFYYSKRAFVFILFGLHIRKHIVAFKKRFALWILMIVFTRTDIV